MANKIVCIGEILWDSIPYGLVLGGAPYNVAYHLKRLGEDVSFISSVGDDRLGDEALKRVRNSGLSIDHIQVDGRLPTGFVEVILGDDGVPDYDIKMPVAWDEIALTGDSKQVINRADALIFGTLAQRSDTSRKTIQWIENSKGIKILDLNFRYPYVDKDIVKQSMKLADIVKLNEDELNDLKSWYTLTDDTKKSLKYIADQFSLNTICLTRGSIGAVLWNDGEFSEFDGYQVNVRDTVGSGDAFLAAFISGYLKNIDLREVIDYSNRLGAFVASHNGGTPGYSIDSYSDIPTLPLNRNAE